MGVSFLAVETEHPPFHLEVNDGQHVVVAAADNDARCRGLPIRSAVSIAAVSDEKVDEVQGLNPLGFIPLSPRCVLHLGPDSARRIGHPAFVPAALPVRLHADDWAPFDDLWARLAETGAGAR